MQRYLIKIKKLTAGPEAGGRVEGDVLGGDSGGGVDGGRDGVRGSKALDAAALVLPDDRHELERDLGVRIHSHDGRR